jgi:curved DNA-binding protein CbpA
MKDDPYFMEKITRTLEARKAASRILDVCESAGMNELKKAYRKAAAKYHPDHNGNTVEANKRFIMVKCAYEMLAFDKLSDKLLEEINSWPGVPKDGKYRLDNPWGHFLWWREKFFELNEKKERPKDSKAGSCI